MNPTVKVKTKTEMANEYGVHRNTFSQMLKEADIIIIRRRIRPKEQELIYKTFGDPIILKAPNVHNVAK